MKLHLALMKRQIFSIGRHDPEKRTIILNLIDIRNRPALRFAYDCLGVNRLHLLQDLDIAPVIAKYTGRTFVDNIAFFSTKSIGCNRIRFILPLHNDQAVRLRRHSFSPTFLSK